MNVRPHLRPHRGPVGNLGLGMIPNVQARGEYLAKEAAARGDLVLGGFPWLPPPPPPPPQLPPGVHAGLRRRRRDEDITPKITGGAPVLPARRKQDFGGHQQPVPEPQVAVVVPPPRSPESRYEHDAMVSALRRELDSTAVHMQVLEARRAKLLRRLADLGEAG